MPKTKSSVFAYFVLRENSVYKCKYCSVRHKKHATRMSQHLMACSDALAKVQHAFAKMNEPKKRKCNNNFMDIMSSEDQVCNY